ncbi:MAG: hypothetical protein HY271_01065 [Deltaproteobacteria bacterium]|nr:hypothetical protein [Deltaproteobacteria bacterium]
MRTLAIVLLVVFLAVDAHADDVAVRPTSDPVTACQEALARASRQLGDGIRRQVGRCIAAGVRCLTTDGADPSACCAAAAPRCHAQQLKLARDAQRFAVKVASGCCTRIAFSTVLDANGLGFASAAHTCQCLPAPTEVADLRSLGTCVGRLVDSATTRLLAVAEVPRAAEALACVGLEHELDALEASDAAAACDHPTPTVTLAGPTPMPTRTRRPRRTPTTPFATASPTVAPTPTLTGIPTPSPTSTPVCGNGIVEGDEECDGRAYDTDSCLEDVCTCDDFCDDAGGRLACRRDCTIDFSGCRAGGCEF